MSDFLKPLGGRYLGASGPIAPTAIAGTVPDPPRSFARLDPGTIIKGVVIGRESDGLIAIATDKGTVRVASNAPLAAGVHVTLEVRPAGNRLQVLILATDQALAPSHEQHPAPHHPATPGTGTSAKVPESENRAVPRTSTAAAAAPVRDPSVILVAGSSLRAVVVHEGQVAPPVSPHVEQASTGENPSGQVTSGLATQESPNMEAGHAIAVAQRQAAIAAFAAATHIAQAVAADVANLAMKNPATGDMTGNAPTAAQALPQPAAEDMAGHPAQGMRTPSQPGVAGYSPPMAGTHASDPKPPQAAGLPFLPSALPPETRERILTLFAAADAPGTPATNLDAPEADAAEGEHAASAGLHPQILAATGSERLPIGAELKLRVVALQLNARQPIEVDPAAADHGNIIMGRVVAITPSGHAVIHTPVGDILMQSRSSLPQGAQIALNIDALELQGTSVMIPQPTVQTPQQALLSLSRNWPTLADLIAIFQGGPVALSKTAVDPEIARQALAMLPHFGARLGAGMVNAMAALRGRDIGRLLGSFFAAKGAGAEKDDLVRRLRGEFAQLSALAQDRSEIDWRALFLPVLDDQGRVGRINIFYRRPKRGDDDLPGSDGGTRFVVEADFSRLGPFQLDGLMRQHRFDLMVRSKQRLTDRMRRDIEAIYEEARGITGFAGSIAFQTVDDFPVAPLDEMKRGGGTVTV